MITTECLTDSIPVKARNQGNRPTCVAFAVTDLNRRFADDELGPEYFYRATIRRIPGWKPGDGVQLTAVAEASQAGHALEAHYSYQADEPVVPLEMLPDALDLFGRPIHFFHPDVDEMIDNLRMGVPVGLALRLTYEFYSPVDGMVPFTHSILPGAMQHAVVTVGLGHDARGEIWFLIRNSWGEAWGHNGHAWIPAAYIAMHATCAFGVEHGSPDSA
ncbi:C1 family peptidase [Pseudomonas sp. MF6755]|uniref:C1 family peptidase n=1 Tax=Pseudomonas sp. MF6755 TaxID=2797530 RepID=UPI0018E8F63E|nr:C1 family peptidase [Pseudomonas sp. MF6755]